MKKLLLTIGTLSCSSLIASALTLENCTAYFDKDADGNLLCYDNGGSSVVGSADSQTDIIVNGKIWGDQVNNSGRYRSTIAFKIDLSKVNFNTQNELITISNGSATMGVGLAANDVFTGVWGNNAAWTKFENAKPTENSYAHVVFTFDQNGATIYVNGTGVTQNASGLTTQNGPDFTTLTIHGEAVDAISEIVVWSQGSANNYQNRVNKSLSALASVPEPSAFGLLAGVGALALVASRRRRK